MLYAVDEAKTWKYCKFLSLKEDVTHLNFSAFVLAAGLSICMFVFLSSTQGFILGDILKIEIDKIGDIAGNLTLFDECISLIMVYVWGIRSDRVGRTSIYATGFLLIGVALIAFPFATNVNSDLLVYRGLFAIGAAATSSMLTAVLADYAAENDRSKISGLVGLMSGVGALVAVFFFLPLPAKFPDPVKGLRTTYAIVGGVSIVFGIFLLFALRPKTKSSHDAVNTILLHNNSNGENENTFLKKKPPTLLEGFRMGLQAAKEDRKIMLGYMGSFLARGDTVIVTIFIPLWVYKFYVENHLCKATDVHDPDIKDDCRDAYVQASILSGITQTAALVAAPIFGYLGDRFFRSLVVCGACFIGMIGYMWMFFSPDPTSKLMFAVAIVVGIGEMGIVVSSMCLVTSSDVPVHVRGSISGAYSFCGTIGILVTSKMGGYFFDEWTSTAPFFIMAVGNVVVLVASCVVFWNDMKSK